MTLGLIHYYARRFEEAAAAERKALELRAQLPLARHFLARALLALGRPAEAVALYAQVPRPRPRTGSPPSPSPTRGRGCRSLRRAARSAPGHEPLAHARGGALPRRAGDRAAALDMLERTAASDPAALPALVADPAFDPLRADPRFASVAQGAEASMRRRP